MLGDVVPELVLVVGGVIVLLYALAAPRRLQGGAAVLAMLTVAIAAAATIPMLDGPEAYTFAETYARDLPAVWAKLIVLVATAAVIALSVPWFRSDPRSGEYYTLLLFSSLGAVLLAGATDLKQFVVSMLLSSATGFVLVAYHRLSRASAEAGIKYYLLGAMTSASMLIGVAYLFGLGGTTTLPGLSTGLAAESGTGLAVAAALVIIAVAFKLGAVPAHAWMPDVAEGAPAPVAAFVTSVPKVGAFLFLARLMLALPLDGLGWRPLVAVIAAATMTLGNLAALWQDDVRRLLGWSSVSQTGYGLLAIVALERSDLALPALLYFLLAYVLANVAAFGVVVQLRGRTDRSAYRGLARARPVLAAILTITMLSFIGVPPLAGFAAKLALFAAAIDAGYVWLAILGAINTVVSIAYYARVLAPMYFKDLEGPVPVLSRSAGIAAVATGAAVVLVGIGAEPFFGAFDGIGLLPG
ncbi:NADH-quinone oxidoreductase subunit N [Actinomarinicola tropica]|uniref:NADH-quinone oxidoreductase subunit N n=1 Tax=Actinomarinicola tropica TaxID=2789776 RepID=A0A5Q2RK23_9ACTN|nr:NADH-quinone oxidoreductase subunit N [Actinomarinicola tropica]QGG97139.1 NADH-quinone oxidoreductase subunit NuoN [Actinomarinicola tropica]